MKPFFAIAGLIVLLASPNSGLSWWNSAPARLMAQNQDVLNPMGIAPQTKPKVLDSPKAEDTPEDQRSGGLSGAIQESNREAYKRALAEAENHMRNQNYRAAMEAYQKALEARPRDPEALAGMERASKKAEPVKTGLVRIKVTPPSAIAQIRTASNSWEERVGSDGYLYLGDVPFQESFDIIFQKVGWKSEKLGPIVLTKEKPEMLSSVKLEPSKAAMAVKTNTPKVKIEITGDSGPIATETGDDSTALIPDLLVGVPYTVSLSKNGFKSETVSVTIPEQFQGSVFSLEPIALQTLAVDNQILPPNPDPSTNITITLSLSKGNVKPGDEITITFEADRDAYLTIMNVGSSGRVVRLWPNDYSGNDNIVKANTRTEFPGQPPKFKFKMAGPSGTDRIIAYATSESGKILSEEEFGTMRNSAFKEFKGKAKDLSVRFRQRASSVTPDLKWGTAQVDITIAE